MYLEKKQALADVRALQNTDQQFRDLYRVIFSRSEFVMSETSTTLKIHKKTYGEARGYIESLAAGIVAKLGQKREYIGLYGTNSEQWIFLFWAILRSGNLPYLINIRQPKSFTDSVLHTLQVKTVICIGDAVDLEAEVILYSELEALGKTVPLLSEEAEFGNEVAMTTSGTTLEEKVCIYRGENFCRQICATPSIAEENTAIVDGYRGTIKHLVFLPFYHIFGFSAVYLWFSFTGATFVFPPAMSPDVLLRTVRRHEVTHIFAVPLLWHAIEANVMREIAKKDEKTRKKFQKGTELSLKLQQSFPVLGRKLAAKLFSEIRAKLFGDRIVFCISGGSAINPSAMRLINAIGYPLYNGYGMTEIGITSVELSNKVQTRLKATIGRPFAFAEYRVGENGHLQVRGNAACHEMILSGARRRREEWFDTGDFVECGEDGRYTFCGRATDVIISENGENVNPDRIRQAFRLSGAINFEVIAEPTLEVPMLVVQIPRDCTSEQMELLNGEIEAANHGLPMTTRVRVVKFTVDPLMKETDIKISRSYLKRAIEAGWIRLFDRNAYRVEAEQGDGDDLKSVLRQLLAEVLEMDSNEISDHANFMTDLGGNSLDYYALIGRIDEKFGIQLPFEAEGFSYSLHDIEKLVKERLAKCMNSSDGSR